MECRDESPCCTFNVGALKVLQVSRTKAGPVVPQAVILLCGLVLAARLRVGVIEVTVDGCGGAHQSEARKALLMGRVRAPYRAWPGAPGARAPAWPRGAGKAGWDGELTAEIWGPPVHTHALVQAGLGVGGHCVTQTLAVSAHVTPTCVAHTGLIVGQVVHLWAGLVSMPFVELLPLAHHTQRLQRLLTVTQGWMAHKSRVPSVLCSCPEWLLSLFSTPLCS